METDFFGGGFGIWLLLFIWFWLALLFDTTEIKKYDYVNINWRQNISRLALVIQLKRWHETWRQGKGFKEEKSNIVSQILKWMND